MPSINPVSQVCEILPTMSLCVKCNSVAICLEFCRKKYLEDLKTKCHDVMKISLAYRHESFIIFEGKQPI